MKIVITGRPINVVEREDHTLLTFQSGKPPPPAKGVPDPPSTPTNYCVYVGKKQWRKFKEILQNPEDIAIIDGFPSYHPSYKGILVFGIGFTTKLTQAGERLKNEQKLQQQTTPNTP